jgi:3',5'-cyclic-AMP phosphodiesterase
LCVAQISDCHLGATKGEALLGMDTDHSLEMLLRQLEDQRDALDLLVVSGDVSSDGHEAAYHRLLPRLQGMAKRVVWMSGNHDDADKMRAVVGDELMPSVLELEGWQLVFLNSAVPGQVGGDLVEREMSLLRRALQCDLPTLIFLHHHVLPVGCEWLDEQRVANADALCELLREYPQVKALVSGHVHQASDQQLGGLRQLTTPSSCIQFAPNSADFALDTLNPGYRCFLLSPSGQFKSRVKRLEGVEFVVDHSASGY